MVKRAALKANGETAERTVSSKGDVIHYKHPELPTQDHRKEKPDNGHAAS